MKRPLVGLAILTLALTTTACSNGDDNGAAADGESPVSGIAYGAPKEEWIAAFEDVEPVTLYSQVLYADGNLHNKMLLDYYDEIEEYSDGKITFDVQFSSAIAPYGETYNAIVDGRLDIGYGSPSFLPQDFPVTTAWNSLAVNGQKGAFPGVLHTHSWVADAMFADEAVSTEFDDFGLHLLTPFAYGGYDQGLVCTSDLKDASDFEGKTWLVQSKEQERQAKALGMNAVSIPFQDYFSALERGIGDCAGNTVTSAHSNGLFEVAPHVILDEDEFIGNIGGLAVAINKDIWDGLPLVAQQLFFDKLEVMATSVIESAHTARLLDGLEGLEAIEGSTLHGLDSESADAIGTTQDEIVSDVLSSGTISGTPDEISARVEELTDKWDGLIADLKLPTISYDEMTTEWDSADVDLEAWAKVYFEEALLPHRPE